MTILWAVHHLQVYPEHDGQKDVVFKVDWCCNAIDEENGVGVATYGSTNVEYNPENEFVSYEDLTQEECLEWVKEKLGAEGVEFQEAATLDLLNKKKAPPQMIELPLPWNPKPIDEVLEAVAEETVDEIIVEAQTEIIPEELLPEAEQTPTDPIP